MKFRRGMILKKLPSFIHAFSEDLVWAIFLGLMGGRGTPLQSKAKTRKVFEGHRLYSDPDSAFQLTDFDGGKGNKPISISEHCSGLVVFPFYLPLYSLSRLDNKLL